MGPKGRSGYGDLFAILSRGRGQGAGTSKRRKVTQTRDQMFVIRCHTVRPFS